VTATDAHSDEVFEAHRRMLDASPARSRHIEAPRAVNLAELRAAISSFGFRRSMRVRPDELRRLTVPTLLIWGDNDPVGAVEVAQATATLIPEARLEVLPGGHVPYLGNPERVSELLTSFVCFGDDD
jgi:pimeloyl-ACP methyl ester carboxylesterase